MAVDLVKTWVSNMKVVSYVSYPTQTPYTRQLVYLMKTAFTDAGWTVSSSSDSVSTGVSPLDYWTSNASIIASASGNYSWVVLKNTAISPTFEVVLDMKLSTYTGVNVYCSYDGYQTDGTISSRPTVNVGGVEHAFGKLTFHTYTANTNCGFVSFYTTDGSCFRLFLTWGGSHHHLEASGGVLSYLSDAGFLLFEVPRDAPSWMTRKYIANSAAILGGGNYGSFSYPGVCSTTYIRARTSIGSSEINIGFGTIGLERPYGSVNTSSTVRSSDMGGNVIITPVYLISNTSAYPGVYGRLYDAYFTSVNLPEGCYIPTSGSVRGLYHIGDGAFGSDGGYLGLP